MILVIGFIKAVDVPSKIRWQNWIFQFIAFSPYD